MKCSECGQWSDAPKPHRDTCRSQYLPAPAEVRALAAQEEAHDTAKVSRGPTWKPVLHSMASQLPSSLLEGADLSAGEIDDLYQRAGSQRQSSMNKA